MSGTGLRAVVVEDDDDVRRLLEIVISQCGFAVTAVATGADGTDAVRRDDPDLVTVDVGLPDIQGYRVVEQLREFYSKHVIMVSARADDADVTLGLHAGADAYVTKPFRPRQLRERITDVMAVPPVADGN
ncbi:response regulator transcription factor [Spelaeicoccus albus]|uniref:DNA-binding response OmpR family regulator n=1 Tax=Spelaeicoccus albus TaxID=1280376 RepID=A0A7Z0D2B3_9MICO|nr:response regulator [Spelaeicoccus albus]NYI67573.1 DNA-binding response OmpR family regulator [Spelaeicoccus albus]